MKVLFLNHNHERFGTYFRCYHLGKQLAKLDISVTMICASGKNFDFFIRKRQEAQNFRIITLPRIKYHKYNTGQIMRLFLTIPIILFSDYDILHAFTVAQPQIGIPALLAKIFRGKKLVVDWDDLWGGGFAEKHNSITSKVLSFFESYIPKFADRITFVSDLLGNKISTMGLWAKATKIPNGIDLHLVRMQPKTIAMRELHLDRKKHYIVAVGNTYFATALRVLFSTLKLLNTRSDEYRLIMIGFTDIHSEIKPIFEYVRKYVLLPGTVSPERVYAYLSAAEVLVLPMENNPIENARFPVRLAQYLMSGKPIVSNAVGEVKKILHGHQCGIVVEKDDFHEMAKKILHICKNPHKYSFISRKAKTYAQSYLSWAKISTQVKDLYETLL